MSAEAGNRVRDGEKKERGERARVHKEVREKGLMASFQASRYSSLTV